MKLYFSHSLFFRLATAFLFLALFFVMFLCFTSASRAETSSGVGSPLAFTVRGDLDAGRGDVSADSSPYKEEEATQKALSPDSTAAGLQLEFRRLEETNADLASARPWIGKPVEKIIYVFTSPSFDDDVSPPWKISDFLGPKEGFSFELSHRIHDRVMGEQTFASAKINLLPQGDSVSIVVQLVARRVVNQIQIHVDDTYISRDAVLQAIDKEEGAEIVYEDLAVVRQKMTELLHNMGYPSAQIHVQFSEIKKGEPLRGNLVIDVKTGPAAKITSRYIKLLHPEKLQEERGRARIETLLQTYQVSEGDIANEANLALADKGLSEKLRKSKYFMAKVTHEVQAETPTKEKKRSLERGGVKLHVYVELGPFVSLRFEGNEHYDTDALRAALDIDNDPEHNTEHLTEKLRQFYQARGFFDVDIEASLGDGDHKTKFKNDDDGPDTLSLNFRIFERHRVKVMRREYICVDEAELQKMDHSPKSLKGIGEEIDSFLEAALPGSEALRVPEQVTASHILVGDRNSSKEAEPLLLSPRDVYVSSVYDAAIQHLQDLYRSEGYLHAQIGPVQLRRKRCMGDSAFKGCLDEIEPLPTMPSQSHATLSEQEQERQEWTKTCRYTSSGLPAPYLTFASNTCVEDRARGVYCSPKVVLRIPLRLGPRTELYDVRFSGVKSLAEKKLFDSSEIKTGEPVSATKLDGAIRKILSIYREMGFVYAEAKWTLEPSPDHTRALVHFEISEGEMVRVSDIVIRGNQLTKSSLIEKRILLKKGEPYKANLVARTQELVGTLGVFNSVSVSLENPEVPQPRKRVIVSVSERPPYMVELSGGFYTSEGFRVGGELGLRNLFGLAISASISGQVSYLPTVLIFDSDLKNNFSNILGEPGFSTRIAAKLNVSLRFPDLGLGPRFQGAHDVLFVHDLQRDYYVRKISTFPTFTWRISKQLQLSFSPSLEFNSARIFASGSILAYLQSRSDSAQLARALLLPDGDTYAIVQKFLVTWDRRNNALDPSSGTLVSLGIEHVDGFPFERGFFINTLDEKGQTKEIYQANPEYHFLKFTPTFSGYMALHKRLRLAFQLRLGVNVQLTGTSQTYPDRLFFMGGSDSMRAWNISSFIPQDDVDRIVAGEFDARYAVVRGGNFMFNPRLEFRIPFSEIFETALFADVGNLWKDPKYPFEHRFALRAAFGTGLRFITSVFPIALDIGINPAPYSWERFLGLPIGAAFNFSIGLF